MKRIKTLSLLLALCMIFSLAMPVSAFAEEDTAPVEEPVVVVPVESAPVEGDPADLPADGTPADDEPAADEPAADEPAADEPAADEPSDFVLTKESEEDDGDAEITALADAYNGAYMKILFLDCGRKYFTVDWVKALIVEMKAAGFTHLQLGFGNDGLRFLLDDMSVFGYSSDSVKAAIQAGNDAFDARKSYTPEGAEEWTQADMDEIIAAANKAGIGIIPLLNTPGHMDAILSAITSLTGSGAYNSSVTTIDLANETAVNFSLALAQKYIAYFVGKGCTVFNMGCDEYANDVYETGGMGMGQLQSSGAFEKFINYVNTLAGYVVEAGMTPMAFNDGVLYNKTTSPAVDTSVLISYWTPGWSGYNVAAASTLKNAGYSLVNTNGSFYYVLGKGDNFDAEDGYSYASNWGNNTFPTFNSTTNQWGTETVASSSAMFCIWCDYPAAESETEIAQNIRLTLRAMGAAMSGTYDGSVSEDVVSGGFNADGTVNVVVENVTKTDENTGIKVTAPGLTGLKVDVLDEASYPGTASQTVGYNITPEDANGDYNGDATVTVPVPEEMTDTSRISVWDVKENNTIPSTVADGYITFTVTHFSEYDIVYNTEEPEYSKEIDLVYGGESVQREITGENLQEQVDRSKLNESVATVDVTGVNGQEASTTYTEASVTCNTLISNNSNSWTAVSGYYYKADDGNYYPLYAQRSRSYVYGTGWTYTYTWGYSTTSSSSNVTQIGTQSTTNTNTTPNITVYTQKTVEAVVASTTITFTPKGAGTTYVTVGSYTYKIVVAKAQTTINVVIGKDTKIDLSGAYEIIGSEGIAECSVTGTEMTITGVAVGTFTVTDANTIYTVKVIEEDLSTVNPLTVEYWITNGRPTDSSSNNSVKVSAADAYSQEGLAVTSFVPVNTTKETRTLQFWRCRLLDTTLSNSSKSGTEEQAENAGDDETYSGVEFTKVRYWNGTWAVYTENNEWVDVTASHQLVAYYLEILPVADELTVTAADWGKKGDGSSSGDYLDPSSSCTVSVQVVYEDGTTNPASTTAADLKSSTIAYGYWSQGRGVGTLNLIGLEGYQIWKVEAETGAMTYASSSTTWGSFTVTSFTWDGNTMTVFEDAENPVDSYIIHNDANNPSTDGYYQNLMWDENKEAILITVYVKAKPTEDNLTVIYYDEKFGEELYSYSINVAAGVTFANITPEPSVYADNTERIDVTGCGIVNTLGVTQKFQTDLTQVPEAVGKYDSELYSYTGSVISEDGMTLYLYYNINTEVLKPMYVVDFGLPITFSRDVVAATAGTIVDAKVGGQPKYGTLSYDADTEMFTYTPTTTLKGVDILSISVKFVGESTFTVTNVGVMPATTVYYEEGFATCNGFTNGSMGSAMQTAEISGSKVNNYGYDPVYNVYGASGASQAVSTTLGSTATFTFTGTGVDIYTNNSTDTGALGVAIKDSTGSIVKFYIVNTAMVNGSTTVTEDQNVIGYNVPVVSVTGLAHGSYTVSLVHTTYGSNGAVAPVYIDGFRVYGTLEDEATNTVYAADLEENPSYIELRNNVLAAFNVSADGQVDQVYSTAVEIGDQFTVALVTAENVVDENYEDWLTNGPKNEIYLRSGEKLVFTVNTGRAVQIGLRHLSDGASAQINGESVELCSSTDMFYTIDSGRNTIENTGTGILAITKLKICDDPGAALVPMTVEDLSAALGVVEQPEEPAEPEVEYADATLTVKVNGSSTTLTKNGVVGESATFTAEEIEAAAQTLVPDGYQLKEQAEDVTVTYGESAKLTLKVEKVPAKPERPEKPEKPSKPEKPAKPELPGKPVQDVIYKITYVLKAIFGKF